jgi:AbrB family looped-hinge helix DNA binding protein
MFEYRAKIAPNGRLIIPAQCRKELDLSANDEVIIRVENGEATLFSVGHTLKKAREILDKQIRGKKSVVDDLIEM